MSREEVSEDIIKMTTVRMELVKQFELGIKHKGYASIMRHSVAHQVAKGLDQFTISISPTNKSFVRLYPKDAEGNKNACNEGTP